MLNLTKNFDLNYCTVILAALLT